MTILFTFYMYINLITLSKIFVTNSWNLLNTGNAFRMFNHFQIKVENQIATNAVLYYRLIISSTYLPLIPPTPSPHTCQWTYWVNDDAHKHSNYLPLSLNGPFHTYKLFIEYPILFLNLLYWIGLLYSLIKGCIERKILRIFDKFW